MQNIRRFGTIFALATATAGMAAMTAATPATAAPRGPQPVNNWLQQVRANSTSWVTINWRTDRPVCDAEVRVRGERVRVDYLGNRRSATFSRGDSLRPGRTDFTRVRVTTAPMMRNDVVKLWATIKYDECGWKARTQTRTTVLSLPVVRHNTWPGGNGGPGAPGQGHPGGHNPGGPGNHGGQPGGPGHHGGQQGGSQGGQQGGSHGGQQGGSHGGQQGGSHGGQQGGSQGGHNGHGTSGGGH